MPEPEKKNASLTELSVGIGGSVIALAAGIAQVATSGSTGAWWIIAAVGLIVVLVAAALLRQRTNDVRRNRVSVLAAVVGGAAIAVGILGGFGLLDGRAAVASSSTGGGPASSPAPQPGPVSPAPNSPSPSPSPDLKTAITSPDDGDAVVKCDDLEGTVHLDASKTLVLSNVREGDQSGEHYFQVVAGWEDVASRTSWKGTQYFGTQPGQRNKVELLSVNPATVRAAEADPANKNNWHSTSLPKGAKVEDAVTLKRGPNPKVNPC